MRKSSYNWGLTAFSMMIIWKYADELYMVIGGAYTYFSWFVFVGQVNDIHKTIVTTHNMLTRKVFARCFEPLLQTMHVHVGWAFAYVVECVKLIETHIKWKKIPLAYCFFDVLIFPVIHINYPNAQHPRSVSVAITLDGFHNYTADQTSSFKCLQQSHQGPVSI